MSKILLCIVCLVFSIVSNSQSTDSLVNKADLLLEKKKFTEALALYDKAMEKDSLNFDLYIGRGRVYSEIPEPQKAYNDYTKAIELQPQSAEGYHWRAILTYSLMYTEESIMDNTRAIDLATNDTVRMMAFANRGNAKQQKRDFQGAFEDYSRAYMYDSSGIGILNNMATVLDELGRADEATEYLKRVVKKDPKFVGGYINLGFQYTRLKRYREAVEYFNKALEIEKNNPLALNNRGLAKYYLKDYDGALSDINKSITIYPANSYAYKNRALVYIAKKQIEKACSDLHKATDMYFTQEYGTEVEELLKCNCK
jgi:tetratricopeptide (TPR) repeat protein